MSPKSLAPSSSSVLHLLPHFPYKIDCKSFKLFLRGKSHCHSHGSDFALKVPAELEWALRLNAAQNYITKRPWLDRYGINVRPVAPIGSSSRKVQVDSSILHRCLPDELLFELSGVVENHKILQAKYDTSWRKMWLLRPRVRTDGLYVSRNTYIRTGIAEWEISNPVHLVRYYRYIRLFSSGRFLYKNSSQKLKDVAKYMNFRGARADCVFSGHYTLSDDKVEAAVLYPGMRPTVLRIRLRHCNSLHGLNILGVVEGWQDDVPAVSHKKS